MHVYIQYTAVQVGLAVYHPVYHPTVHNACIASNNQMYRQAVG